MQCGEVQELIEALASLPGDAPTAAAPPGKAAA